MAIVGTFSVMYAARLQHRQSVAHGAHARRGLRRRRRDRDAREHRAPHRDGEDRRCRRRSTAPTEVGFTILSMTLSLAAVFIPLMFMGGIIGRLFREFAITISVAILVSGFVSLTLTPMLCSRFLKPQRRARSTAASTTPPSARSTGALHGYERSLGWVMRHRPLTLVFSALILVATGVLFDDHPEGTLPARRHRAPLSATTEAAQGTSFTEMVRLQHARDARRSRRDTNVAATCRTSAAWRIRGNLNIIAQAGRAAAAGRRDGARAHAPAVAAFRGSRCSSRIRRASASAGAARRVSYQFTLQGHDMHDALRQRAAARGQAAADAAAHRRDDATC